MERIKYSIIYPSFKVDATGFIAKLDKAGFVRDDNDFQFLFALGGDGNFIDAKDIALNHDCIIVPINYGGLGFYSSFMKDSEDEAIDAVLNGKFTTTSFDLLEVDIDGEVFYAINELHMMCKIEAFKANMAINGKEFEEFNGSGFIIATQSGSNALARSLGGAVLFNKDTFEVLEIAGINNRIHHSFSSPIILGKGDYVEFSGFRHKETDISVDTLFMSKTPLSIKCKISDKKVKVLDNGIDKVDRVKRSN